MSTLARDTPTATTWLPAKSWQHFFAGGYAPRTAPYRAFFINFARRSQSGGDVRRRRHESI